jgi:dienelactone hydrolase
MAVAASLVAAILPGTAGAHVDRQVSSVPTKPIQFTKGTPFTLNSSETNYWVYVPDSYDGTHATPTTLFVWLHGCGGESSGDINTVSPGGSQDWISIAVGGREDACWDPNTDQTKVFAAIADLKTHFNINPRRVILGGYSSGGDLAYRIAFYNASFFAGLLAENTSPFRDTGSSQAASLAAASWKFNVVHLAHLQDDTYPIDGVRQETDALAAAGFPLLRIERPGTHYDDPGPGVPGTDADLQALLLPHIDDGWLSPADVFAGAVGVQLPKSARFKHGKVQIPVTCQLPIIASDNCDGAVQLGAGANALGRDAAISSTQTIGQKSFSVAAAQTATIKLKLKGKAKKALLRKGKLKVKAKVRNSGNGAHKTFKLKLKK